MAVLSISEGIYDREIYKETEEREKHGFKRAQLFKIT